MTDAPNGEEATSLCYIDLWMAKELALQEFMHAASMEVQHGNRRDELANAGRKYETACRSLHDFKFDPTSHIYGIGIAQAVSPLAQFGIELQSDKVKKALNDMKRSHGFIAYVEETARQATAYIEKLEKRVVELEERIVTCIEIPLPDGMAGSEMEARQKLRQILHTLPETNRATFLLTLMSRPALMRQLLQPTTLVQMGAR